MLNNKNNKNKKFTYTHLIYVKKCKILESIKKRVDLKPLNIGLNSVQAEYLVERDTNVNTNQQLKPAEFISIYRYMYVCMYIAYVREIMGMIY